MTQDREMLSRSGESSDVEMESESSESSPSNPVQVQLHRQIATTSSSSSNHQPFPTAGTRRSTRTRSISNTQPEPSSSSRRLNSTIPDYSSSPSYSSSSSIIIPNTQINPIPQPLLPPPQHPPSPSNASTSQSNDSDDDDEDEQDEKDEKRNKRGHFADGFDEIEEGGLDREGNDESSPMGIGSRTRAATLTQRAILSNSSFVGAKGKGKGSTGGGMTIGGTSNSTGSSSNSTKLHHSKPILPRPRSLVGHSPNSPDASTSLVTFSPVEASTPSNISWIAAREEAEGSRSPIFEREARLNALEMVKQGLLRPKIVASGLPPEILFHIFKYLVSSPPDLKSCLIACKSWCLCGVELLWHRPNFFKLEALLNLVHILTRSDQTFFYGGFIRRLNFSALAGDLNDAVFSKMEVCVRLERLTLAGCKLVSDETLTKVLSKTPQLVAIDLTDVSLLTDATLFVLADSCPRLQGINLSGCINVTSTGVSALARSCPLLRRVKLCSCRLVGDEALLVLTEYCPQLLEVDLINCPLITDESVSQIWIKSFQMRELRLAQCVEISNSAFPETPFPGMKNPRPPAAAIAARARSDGNAMEISSTSVKGGIGGENSNGSVSGHASMSAPVSRGNSPVGGIHPRPSSSIHLEPRSDPTILASSLVHSKSGNSNQSIGIENNGNPMAHLPTPHIFDHLRILDLTSCSLLTDSAVAGLVASVPRIRNLILAKCNKLTDDAVYSISKLGKGLHFLHLGHVLK